MKQKTRLFVFLISISFSGISYSAEYQGSNLDGESYSCTAFSYDTSKYYYLTCEFYGSDVTLYFDNGGYITVSMDDGEIDDPSSISAYDYNKGNYWDLEIDI